MNKYNIILNISNNEIYFKPGYCLFNYIILIIAALFPDDLKFLIIPSVSEIVKPILKRNILPKKVIIRKIGSILTKGKYVVP